MDPKIIQIVGFSNSGKTTLVEKLIAFLIKEDFRVGSIKHHGHGGELTAFDEGKDSWRHRQAGAVISGAVSKRSLQVTIERQQDWEPEQLILLYQQFPIDVIVIEGFKMSPFPKMVLIKEEKDLQLVDKLTNICCIISWLTNDLKVDASVPCFHLDDEASYMKLLLNELKGHANE